jgi:hypothetical protein
MDAERIGYLGYRLYRLGWQSALYRDRASLEHLLLTVFLYYRRGFASGTKWVQESCRQEEHR